jgi:hypothetical protein
MTVFAVACAVSVSVAQQSSNDVAFGGKLFLRFRATVGGLNPESRAIALQSRLTHVFTNLMARKYPLTVDVRLQRDVRVIYVAKVPFVTVTRNDASKNNTYVDLLTEIWSRNIATGVRAILCGHNEATMAIWLAQHERLDTEVD